MDLAGKAAIVTGASSGIGAACARALARRGCRVSLLARREDRLRAVADEIAAGDGEGAALPIRCDLRDEAAIAAALETSHAHWGRTDVLVNNAGLGRSAPLHGGDSAEWRAMWEVNVHALCVATREALALFSPDDGGHIINISSLSGHRVPPGGGFYAATKHAVKAVTEMLRLELRARESRSRVTAISPGFVETEFFEVLHDGDRARAAEVLGRFEKVLSADDVAATMLHVLEAPDHVSISDVLMRPTEQQS